MEDTHDTRALKIAMWLSIPFFVSLCKSCDDIKYHCSGKTARGVVSKIAEHHSRAGLEGYDVWYDFPNANTKRNVAGVTLVGVNEVAQYFIGQPLEVEYAGDELVTCRIKGTGGWFWQAFFVVSLLALVVVVVVLTLQARGEERRYRQRHHR
jgi:hypothetical protein